MSTNENVSTEAEHIRFRSEHSIESLISSPLEAAYKANSAMQIGQTRFLLDSCFKIKDGVREPINIEMVLQSSNVTQDLSSPSGISISKHEITFQVPLISILPLSNLAVERMKIEFSLDITSMRQRQSNGGNVSIHGRIAKKKDGNAMKHTGTSKGTSDIDISVNIKTQPLPKGTQDIIDLYSKMILPSNGKQAENIINSEEE